jgi:hypothetical protein
MEEYRKMKFGEEEKIVTDYINQKDKFGNTPIILSCIENYGK